MQGPLNDADDMESDEAGFTMPAVGELDYIGGLVRRAVSIALLIIVLSLIAPGLLRQLLDVISSSERLLTIRPAWFLIMILAEIASFACIWWLTKILLPKVSLFVAATSQLTANTVSRVVPGGGAAAGGATLYRMLAVSGTSPTQAGGALAAMSILSTAALFSIPAIGAVVAFFGAPIPEQLLPVAIASGVLFALLIGVGVIAIRFTRPLMIVGRAASKLISILGRLLRREWKLTPEDLVAERDRLVSILGNRWLAATAASALNWMFDYLVLVFALYAVDAEPRLSLVMIAYASGAVLAMIPLTPGGLGFVEVGLTYFLVLSGMSAQDAAVATIAYRVISFSLPTAFGLVAWIAFRRRYPPRV